MRTAVKKKKAGEDFFKILDGVVRHEESRLRHGLTENLEIPIQIKMSK